MQSCLSSYEVSWKALMTTISQGVLADVEAALSAALGDGAAITASAELDAYTGDTDWPARAATRARRRRGYNGIGRVGRLYGGHVLARAARKGRWDAVGAPGRRRTATHRGGRRDGAGDRAGSARPGGPVGRRVGYPGRCAGYERRDRDRPALARRGDRDRR